MTIPRHAVTVPISIPYHDCDPLGVVWHGRYFKYFELARTELMRSIQLDVGDVRKMGYAMYLVDSHCRWMKALRYGDEVLCTAWFTGKEPHFRIAFDLRNQDGIRCSRATMIFAITTGGGRLLSELPPEFREKLPHDR